MEVAKYVPCLEGVVRLLKVPIPVNRQQKPRHAQSEAAFYSCALPSGPSIGQAGPGYNLYKRLCGAPIPRAMWRPVEG